jgi:hypothetical protein
VRLAIIEHIPLLAEREFLIDDPLVRIHSIIEMI